MRSRNASRTVTRIGRGTLSVLVALAVVVGVCAIFAIPRIIAPFTTTAHAMHDTVPRPRADSALVTRTTRTPHTITADSARSIVLAHLPKMHITSQQLRQLDGRLVYAFRLRSTASGTLMRATVDATTGAFSPSIPLAHGRR